MVMLTVKGVVETPYYEWGPRRYIEVRGDDGALYRIKVPFRYGRVMCNMTGLKTIQEFEKGDGIRVMIDRKMWDGTTHLVLISAGPS